MTPTTKRQLITIAILTGLNLLLSGSVVGNGQGLDGHLIESHSAEMRRAALVTNLFGIPLFSFIIGLMVAGIPYQQKTYNQKALYFSLGYRYSDSVLPSDCRSCEAVTNVDALGCQPLQQALHSAGAAVIQ